MEGSFLVTHASICCRSGEDNDASHRLKMDWKVTRTFFCSEVILFPIVSTLTLVQWEAIGVVRDDESSGCCVYLSAPLYRPSTFFSIPAMFFSTYSVCSAFISMHPMFFSKHTMFLSMHSGPVSLQASPSPCSGPCLCPCSGGNCCNLTTWHKVLVQGRFLYCCVYVLLSQASLLYSGMRSLYISTNNPLTRKQASSITSLHKQQRASLMPSYKTSLFILSISLSQCRIISKLTFYEVELTSPSPTKLLSIIFERTWRIGEVPDEWQERRSGQLWANQPHLHPEKVMEQVDLWVAGKIEGYHEQST